MHPLLIVGSLFPATALAVVGFFVLFAAGRAEGRVRGVGNILGVWLYILAAIVIVVGVIGSVTVGRMEGRMGYFHERMMQRWHPGWMTPDGPPPVAAPAAAPSAAPATATSPAPAATPKK